MRNLMIRKSIYLLFAVLGAGLFVACDENIHDFTKKTGSEAANDIYISDTIFNFPVNRTSNAEITGTDSVFATFPVYSTLAAENDITVKLSLDNELIRVYNTVHGTTYISISPDSLILKTTTLTIPKDKNRSSDSFKIFYKGKLKYLTDTRGYLIPVRINSYSGADVKINYEERVSYLVINVTQQNGIGFEETSKTIRSAPYFGLSESFDGMKFKLSSLFGADTDTKVTLTVNNDLIADYNASSGTDYQAVPAGDFDPVEVTLTGGTASVEGAFSYKGDISTLTDARGYIVPFEISSVTGTGIDKINAKKVFYAVLDVNATQNSTVVTDPAELGTIVTDRAGYSVVGLVNAETGAVVSPMAGTAAANIFIDTQTFMVFQKSAVPKFNITIDLGAAGVQNITGLWIRDFNNMNWVKSLDVYYATELQYKAGQSSIVAKIVFATAPVSASNKERYIKFSEPVTARYIMLNNVTPNGAMYGIERFYICTGN